MWLIIYIYILFFLLISDYGKMLKYRGEISVNRYIGRSLKKDLSKRILLWFSAFSVLKCFEAALEDSARQQSDWIQVDPDLFEKLRYFKSSEIMQWFHVRNRLKLKPLLTEDLDIGSRSLWFVQEKYFSFKWTNIFVFFLSLSVSLAKPLCDFQVIWAFVKVLFVYFYSIY